MTELEAIGSWHKRKTLDISMTRPGIMVVTHLPTGEHVAICDSTAIEGELTLERVRDALMTLNLSISMALAGHPSGVHYENEKAA
jgi:hypothetical protein